MRNGSIHRLDVRTEDRRSQILFAASSGQETNQSQLKSPVLNLAGIREWQLLACHGNGEVIIPSFFLGKTFLIHSAMFFKLRSFDLRYVREYQPIMTFEGHVNSVASNTPKLVCTSIYR